MAHSGTNLSAFGKMTSGMSGKLSWKTTWKWILWLVVIVLLSPIVVLLLALMIIFLRWSMPLAVHAFRESVQSPKITVLPQTKHEVPSGEELQFDFIQGARRQYWDVLPTEIIQKTFLVDSTEQYTGINTSLLQGGSLAIECPGYPDDGAYSAWFRTSNTRPIVLQRAIETKRITGADNSSGPVFIKWTARNKNSMGKPVNMTFTIKPLPGHTRIATYKAVEPGEKCLWGLLPDPEKWSFSVYVRFANLQGKTITPSMLQQHPGAIKVGKKPLSGGELIETFAKAIFDPEQVFGTSIAQGEKLPFLMIGAPRIEQAQYESKNKRTVIIEVIVDAVPKRQGS